MEAKLESVNENRAKVSVTVEAKEVSQVIKAGYKRAASKYNFPGFRKGKAPRPIIDSALGEEYIAAQATDSIVNSNYPLAIDELRLYPVGQPTFDEDMPLAVDGQDFVFTFEVDVKVEVALKDYKPVEIEMPATGVSEEEIQEQLTLLAQHYFKYEEALPSNKTKEGDRLTLKQTTTVDSGREIDSISGESFVYTLGSGLLPQAYEEELTGLKKGAKKTFEIDNPTEPTAYTSELKGLTKKIKFDVEVIGVSEKVLPLIDDTFAKDDMGFEDLADLRSHVEESIKQNKDQYMPHLKEKLCMAELVKRLDVEPSEAMCEQRESDLMQDFFKQLQNSGMTFDAYLKEQNLTADAFKEDLKQQAKDVAAEDLALDAWAKEYKLEASDEEVEEEFKKADPDNYKNLMKEWKESGRLYLIREGITRSNAAVNVMDTAIVSESKPAKKEKKATNKKATSKPASTKKTDEKKPAAKKSTKKAE